MPVPIAFLDKTFLANVAFVELAREVTPYVIPHVAQFLRSQSTLMADQYLPVTTCSRVSEVFPIELRL